MSSITSFALEKRSLIMRLLLVEKNKFFAREIQEALASDEYTLDCLDDPTSALHALSYESFDALILDGDSPEEGLSILKSLRKEGIQVPILLISGEASISECVRALDAGADDFLVKPFDFYEMKARLRALLRRSRGSANPIMSYGEIELDPLAHQITYKGKAIKLTRREYVLLRELLQHTGKVLSKSRLEQVLYGWQDEVESNALEVHIHHLRRKFYALLIRTIRGVGYVIEKKSLTHE